MTRLPGRSQGLACLLYIAAAVPIAQAQTTYSETVLHNFALYPKPKGAEPGGLIRDPAGNLYGTAAGGAWNQGVVFRLDTAGRETVLHSFAGIEGVYPGESVARDEAGNLYGITTMGGTGGCQNLFNGCGVVFKLDPAGHETVLYNFTGGADGAYPQYGVVRDAAGNLYGTTSAGGAGGLGIVFKVDTAGHETVLHTFTGKGDGSYPNYLMLDGGYLYGTAGCGGVGDPCSWGTVYKLDLAGSYTVLYAFQGGADGRGPIGGVVRDANGNLYGTTEFGGTADQGLIFKIDPAGHETALHNFAGGAAGANPAGNLLRDAAGNLYGITVDGGTNDGDGLVFELDSAGNYTVLQIFTGTNGDFPETGVISDPAGNLYGTTVEGGGANLGVVFKLDTSGQETVLYSFPSGVDGVNPESAVALDAAGNIYGTTYQGGSNNLGVVYKVDATGHETLLHTFTGGDDGIWPMAGVTLGAGGNLYGTTYSGGASDKGIVYKLDASGQETVLHAFTGEADGGNPDAGVVLDAAGNLYGTTEYGGVGEGVIYKLSPTGQETVLYKFNGGYGNPSGVILDPAGNIYGTESYGLLYKLDTTGNFTVLYTFGGTDGQTPNGLALDSSGNLYGTTEGGGACPQPRGCGVVFKLDPVGNYSVLYTFAGGPDGRNPLGVVVLDAAGNLYGTTEYGGTSDRGVVFRVDTDGNETVLHNFLGAPDGNEPYAGVVFDPAGNLYGTTHLGGKQKEGTVFKLTPQ